MAEPPHQGFHLLAIAGLSGELQQPFAKSRVQCPPLGAGHLPGLLNEIVIGTESNILHTESVYTRIVYLKLADASADLRPEEILHRLPHHLATDIGDGPGERNVFRTDFHAVLRVAAFLDAAVAHQSL